MEKSVAEYGSKLTDSERAEIQRALEQARSVKDGGDVEAIKKAVADLSKASHKLAEEVYSKMGGQGAAGTAGGGTPGGDGGKAGEKVVDAEFEEVDKDKK